MSEKICTVDIGKNSLDNDYTFYSDGRVHHFYDQSQWKLNQEEWITASEISAHKRAKILEKCTPEFKAQIVAIFDSAV